MTPNETPPPTMSFEEVEQKLATLLGEVEKARQDIDDGVAPDLENVATRVDAICAVALSLHREQISQLQPNLVKLREELYALSSAMTDIMESADFGDESGNDANDTSAPPSNGN